MRRSTADSPSIVYVALLRGINVGGKNMLSMKSLKASFERAGFREVSTYINSGNVLFRARERDPRRVEREVDRMLLADYGLPIKTIVRSDVEMARLVRTISKTWKPDRRWRCNVIFLRHPIDSKRILDGVDLKPDLERVVYCPGTLLWSARVNALTRTAMLKLSSKPVYQDMSVRGVNTTAKILALMQRMRQQPGETHAHEGRRRRA